MRYKNVLVVLLFVLFAFTSHAQIAVGYINGNYSQYPYNAIDYENITHIAHAFIIPRSNGSLQVDSWFPYPELIKTAHGHGVKVVLSVGGYGQSDGFSPIVSNDNIRAAFINNLIDYCTKNGYDGIDLDWEYPHTEDRDNFTKLIVELRNAIDSVGMESLSLAISSTDWYNAYDISKIKNYVDWFGIMTYDYYGPWESVAGHDSPLYSSSQQYGSVDRAVKYYLNKGMPKDKMCIGMSFKGYLLNASGLFARQSGGSTISYFQANSKLAQNWEYHWDNTCKVPYLQNPGHTQIITYDDTTSIKLKCDYVRKNDLAGTIFWKLGQDYGNGKTPLLTMLGKYLLNYPAQVPAIPIAVEPKNESKDDSIAVLLKWRPTDETTSYNLQVSDDPDFSTFIRNVTGIDLTYYPVAGLKYSTKYYWRVSSSNLNGTSDWSAVSEFTTQEPTAIKGNQIIVSNFDIANYPNPFNPSTKIRYSIPANGYTSIKVYDLLGREISNLVSGYQTAGVHLVEFSGTGIATGLYICQINFRADHAAIKTFSKQIKLELIK